MIPAIAVKQTVLFRSAPNDEILQDDPLYYNMLGDDEKKKPFLSDTMNQHGTRPFKS